MGFIHFYSKHGENYIKDDNGRQLHFKLKECVCHCQNNPLVKRHVNYILREHMAKLEDLRDYLTKQLGAQVYIKITSPYRCEEQNRKCGGVKNSQHKRGTATDIKAYLKASYGRKVYVKPSIVRQAAIDLNFGGVGEYDTFTHIDSRPLVNGKSTIF